MWAQIICQKTSRLSAPTFAISDSTEKPEYLLLKRKRFVLQFQFQAFCSLFGPPDYPGIHTK